jgi:hypothetical protein
MDNYNVGRRKGTTPYNYDRHGLIEHLTRLERATTILGKHSAIICNMTSKCSRKRKDGNGSDRKKLKDNN